MKSCVHTEDSYFSSHSSKRTDHSFPLLASSSYGIFKQGWTLCIIGPYGIIDIKLQNKSQPTDSTQRKEKKWSQLIEADTNPNTESIYYTSILNCN